MQTMQGCRGHTALYHLNVSLNRRAFTMVAAATEAKGVTLAVLGAGRIGQVHAKALRRLDATVKWITASRESSARSVALMNQIPHWTTSVDDVLNDPEVDAIVICSPTDKHAEQIIAAARRGKHIFCEKPVDLSVEVVNNAIAKVEAAGVKMMVGFNRRFDANFKRIREAIVNDEIGSVTMLRITSRDPSPPSLAYVKSSGGMFKDMTIHDFDMARFLVGEDVDEVFVMTQSRNAEIASAGDIDTAVCLLKFTNGVLAYIENSRDAAYGYDQRVEVLGSKGAVSCDNKYANNVVVSTGESVRRDLPLHFFLERYMDAYVSEMETFVRVVGDEDAEVPVGGHDGREALLLALAAERSRAENRPVKMSEFGRS